MNPLKVKIKKLHKDAVIPTYAKPGDAGMDLTAVSLEIDKHGVLTYDTGLAFEIPEGYFAQVVLRSSVYKTDLMLTNHIGIIDSCYRGSVKFKFALSQNLINFAYDEIDFKVRIETGEALFYPSEYAAYHKIAHAAKVYAIGDRIGQLIIMPYPTIQFEESDELSESERGVGSYGSTGR